jgi:hypothetical protein
MASRRGDAGTLTNPAEVLGFLLPAAVSVIQRGATVFKWVGVAARPPEQTTTMVTGRPIRSSRTNPRERPEDPRIGHTVDLSVAWSGRVVFTRSSQTPLPTMRIRTAMPVEGPFRRTALGGKRNSVCGPSYGVALMPTFRGEPWEPLPTVFGATCAISAGNRWLRTRAGRATGWTSELVSEWPWVRTAIASNSRHNRFR